MKFQRETKPHQKPMKKLLCSIVVLFLMGNLSAQNIDKQWVFNYIHSQDGTSLFEIDETSDTFTLENGAFEYSLAAKNNLKSAHRHNSQI